MYQVIMQKLLKKYEMDITASETFSKDIELLLAGRTDCVINNTIAFADYLNEKPDTPIKIVDVDENADTVAIPIVKGNDDLVEAVDKAIKELQDDGTLTKICPKNSLENISLESYQQTK